MYNSFIQHINQFSTFNDEKIIILLLFISTRFSLEDNYQAYRKCLDEKLNFFDTAEMYGQGDSERRFGQIFGIGFCNAGKYFIGGSGSLGSAFAR
jgi:diketogulonate reductase-like aldo/keto reductase